MKSGSLVASAALLTVFSPLVLFRSPANTLRSGNELSEVVWRLAEHSGSGSWELFPMTITVEVGETATIAEIENCGTSVPPSGELPENTPFPLDYTQDGNSVFILFNEVPRR